MECEANTCKPREKVNCDQEACMQDRIMTAMRMAVELHKQSKVRADEYSFKYGLMGIAEGTAREIIYDIGLEPSFENIRRLEREFAYSMPK